MSRMMVGITMLLLCVACVACGDKVPESKAAKDIGAIPRQAIDKTTTNVDAAIQKGVDRTKEEDKKP